jgi:rhodanese-related sulfurtransferase
VHGKDVPNVPAAEARAWREAHDPYVLDVREPHEYAEVHIPGAHLVPQAELVLRLDEIPRDREILTVCRSGSRSLNAARFLKAIGYERVTNLAGGTQGWVQAGHPSERSVEPATAR